jgi:hypothetical protein
MTKTTKIAKGLRSKNNLSGLGRDGIGYLFMKLGEQPMINWLKEVFEVCVKNGIVPDTWKRSRTVMLYKKGETHIPSNWRPITITSCIYRLFMSLTAQYLQEKVHRGGKRHIFSQAQKCFVSRVPGCMEHAVITRELIAHAKLHKKDLHMVQIDLSNA